MWLAWFIGASAVAPPTRPTWLISKHKKTDAKK
jgi:hypothetical protein